MVFTISILFKQTESQYKYIVIKLTYIPLLSHSCDHKHIYQIFLYKTYRVNW